MKLVLKRIAKKTAYTIGKLYINDIYFCDTLEDTDRGLSSSMSLNTIKAKKEAANTAIPTGIYKVSMNVVSNKYSSSPFYKKLCGSKVPRLLNVPGFDGILIHTGNDNTDTEGCILVGENKQVGKVLNSKVTFEKLYKELLKDKENITIKIE